MKEIKEEHLHINNSEQNNDAVHIILMIFQPNSKYGLIFIFILLNSAFIFSFTVKINTKYKILIYFVIIISFLTIFFNLNPEIIRIFFPPFPSTIENIELIRFLESKFHHQSGRNFQSLVSKLNILNVSGFFSLFFLILLFLREFNVLLVIHSAVMIIFFSLLIYLFSKQGFNFTRFILSILKCLISHPSSTNHSYQGISNLDMKKD